MNTWTPLADEIHFRPSPNHGYGSARFTPRAITWHIAEGGLDGTLSWLTSPASNASAHLVIARDGKVFSLVPLREAAWCQGDVCRPNLDQPIVQQTHDAGLNPNLVSYSIECIGFSQFGHSGALTAAQAAALQRVTAYLCWRSGLSADKAHILRHSEWNSCTRGGCPGYSAEEYTDWVARVAALTQLWRGW